MRVQVLWSSGNFMVSCILYCDVIVDSSGVIQVSLLINNSTSPIDLLIGLYCCCCCCLAAALQLRSCPRQFLRSLSVSSHSGQSLYSIKPKSLPPILNSVQLCYRHRKVDQRSDTYTYKQQFIHSFRYRSLIVRLSSTY